MGKQVARAPRHFPPPSSFRREGFSGKSRSGRNDEWWQEAVRSLLLLCPVYLRLVRRGASCYLRLATANLLATCPPQAEEQNVRRVLLIGIISLFTARCRAAPSGGRPLVRAPFLVIAHWLHPQPPPALHRAGFARIPRVAARHPAPMPFFCKKGVSGAGFSPSSPKYWGLLSLWHFPMPRALPRGSRP